jgi:hypothetical protein
MVLMRRKIDQDILKTFFRIQKPSPAQISQFLNPFTSIAPEKSLQVLAFIERSHLSCFLYLDIANEFHILVQTERAGHVFHVLSSNLLYPIRLSLFVKKSEGAS